MPSREYKHIHRHHASTSTSGKKSSKTSKMYLWRCHICGLGGMAAVTQLQCANCVHTRCPDCSVVATPISDLD